MNEQRPGGWVDGIGWVSLADQLTDGDHFTVWAGGSTRRGIHSERSAWDLMPVIVTRWADGTTPAPPAVSPATGLNLDLTRPNPSFPAAATGQPSGEGLRSALKAFVEATTCTAPAYGAPGHPHCAACCYGTLIAASCIEEFEAATLARRLLDNINGTPTAATYDQIMAGTYEAVSTPAAPTGDDERAWVCRALYDGICTPDTTDETGYHVACGWIGGVTDA